MFRTFNKMADTFLYFGYGSNLLRERILIKNKSAVFKTIAKLDNYALEFDNFLPDGNWKGATATISECPGDHVWGCVWQIGTVDLSNLDAQEGVSNGEYKPITVTVESAAGEQLPCRSYQLVQLGSEDKRPSPQYLSVIQRGATQNQLPQYYQDKLANIEHNGYTGHLPIMDKLEQIIQQFKDKE